MITDYVSLPRCCSDCGKPNPTVLVGGVCRKCWSETTPAMHRRQPATPHLDRYMARLEAREAAAR
jgi:hypothetical protein